MNDKHLEDMRDAKKSARASVPRDARSRDPRFRQLLHKARSGDEIAVHSLWVEYGVDFAKEGGRYE